MTRHFDLSLRAVPACSSQSSPEYSEMVMVKRFLANYLERHRNPVNQFLHLAGLPVTFVLPVAFLIQQRDLWAICAFLVGYALQFLGHFIEGNDAGETILVKKMLGRPYSEFGPLSTQSKSHD